MIVASLAVMGEYRYRQLVWAEFALASLPAVALAVSYSYSRRLRSYASLALRVVSKGWPPRLKDPRIVPFIVGIYFGSAIWLLKVPFSYAAASTDAAVTVYYATNRQSLSDKGRPFANEPSFQGITRYGVATIGVPWKFKRRVSFDPNMLLRRGKTTEPVIIDSLALDQSAFVNRVTDAALKSPEHDEEVYVHGFHTTFDDALTTFGTLAIDLKIQGANVIVSWPSGEGTVAHYDQEQEYASSPSTANLLSGTLALLTSWLRPEMRMNIIAHSMGCRILGYGIYWSSLPTKAFANVILAAADVDPYTFNDVAPAIYRVAQRTTLYVSEWDSALRASSFLHRDDRVGLQPEAYHGVDVVDTTGADTSLIQRFGHSYVFDSDDILRDIAALIHHSDPPEIRTGIHQERGIWVLVRS